MNKDELLELAGNPNFISGIYNYCDRWCERCQFTSRCFLYATEQADPDMADPDVRDINNEKFWKKMQDIFRSTAELITDLAAEQGIDLESIDASEEMAKHDRVMDEAWNSDLAAAAQKYSADVQSWFKEEFANEENVHDDTTPARRAELDLSVSDAAEVVSWYQFFIGVKLMRAIGSISEVDEEEFDDDEILSFDIDFTDADEDDETNYDAIIARSSMIDANGSAKIALVGIDRSIAAWRALQLSLPEKSDTIKPMLVALEQLRRAAEARFPRARDFIRPGFDEAASGLLS